MKIKIRASEDQYEDGLSMLSFYSEGTGYSVIDGLISTIGDAV